MKKIFSFIMVLILLFMAGCGAKKSVTETRENQKGSYSENITSPGMPPESAAQDSTSNTSKANNQDKKIIKNYDIFLAVDDIKIFTKDMESMARSLGGYIQNDNTGEMMVRTVVRVPSDKADSFIEYIDKSYDIKTKTSNADDITQSYVDNDARLNNLKAQEAQFLEILKKANTVDEILKVQNEIYRIRGEIESLEARKKSWDRLIEYATVSITAQRKELVKEQGISIIKGNDFLNAIAKGIKNSGIFFVYALQKLVIFLIGNILWFVILAGAGILGYKKYLRINKTPRDEEKK